MKGYKKLEYEGETIGFGRLYHMYLFPCSMFKFVFISLLQRDPFAAFIFVSKDLIQYLFMFIQINENNAQTTYHCQACHVSVPFRSMGEVKRKWK